MIYVVSKWERGNPEDGHTVTHAFGYLADAQRLLRESGHRLEHNFGSGVETWTNGQTQAEITPVTLQ